MSFMFLATKPHGQPVLICQSGLTIEPDPISGRCIITYPTKERQSPGTLAVSQSFEMFVASVDRAGALIRIEEPAPIAVNLDGAKPVEAEVTYAPKTLDPIAEFRTNPEVTTSLSAQREAEIAKIVEAAPSKNRRRKEKA